MQIRQVGYRILNYYSLEDEMKRFASIQHISFLVFFLLTSTQDAAAAALDSAACTGTLAGIGRLMFVR